MDQWEKFLADLNEAVKKADSAGVLKLMDEMRKERMKVEDELKAANKSNAALIDEIKTYKDQIAAFEKKQGEEMSDEEKKDKAKADSLSFFNERVPLVAMAEKHEFKAEDIAKLDNAELKLAIVRKVDSDFPEDAAPEVVDVAFRMVTKSDGGEGNGKGRQDSRQDIRQDPYAGLSQSFGKAMDRSRRDASGTQQRGDDADEPVNPDELFRANLDSARAARFGEKHN